MLNNKKNVIPNLICPWDFKSKRWSGKEDEFLDEDQFVKVVRDTVLKL